MALKKGDKVLFQKEKRVGEARDPDALGIVKLFPRPGMVDLLCEGEFSDYRTTIDNIKDIYGNVFDKVEGCST